MPCSKYDFTDSNYLPIMEKIVAVALADMQESGIKNKEALMNDTSKGWIMHLPYLIKEEIFCSLPGASLRNARAVCSFWNTYIRDEIWGKKKNRNTIEKRVEENWRRDRCIDKTEYFDLDIDDCWIEAFSANKVVLRSMLKTPLMNARVQVFDVNKKQFWEVIYPFYPLLIQNADEESKYRCVTSDTLLSVRTLLKGPDHVENVQVWSYSSNSKLVDENILNLQCLHTNKENDPDTLILLSNFVQVWKINDHRCIVKLQIPVLEPTYAASYANSFILRHVLYKIEVEGENGNKEEETKRRLTVYKHTKQPLDLYTHLIIPDMDEHWEDNNGNPMKFAVGEISYVGHFFLVTCVVDLPCGNGKSVESLVFRTMTDGGMFIREISFSRYDPEAWVTFFFIDERFIVTIDEETLIFQGNLSELGDKDKDGVQFRKLQKFNGESDCIFTKLRGLELGISTFLDRVQNIL